MPYPPPSPRCPDRVAPNSSAVAALPVSLADGRAQAASWTQQAAYLASLAPSQIGVVLNVGTAHVGEFGSLEAIATAKGRLDGSL
ncbi:Mur ligase family protein [Streptomyces sp. NPDC056656]|uniref:Mur ligase family protein n=1 Tax=Streptomyces sp. NPDC056656 TaxID=3345895 RepID=UPI0036B4E629